MSPAEKNIEAKKEAKLPIVATGRQTTAATPFFSSTETERAATPERVGAETESSPLAKAASKASLLMGAPSRDTVKETEAPFFEMWKRSMGAPASLASTA